MQSDFVERSIPYSLRKARELRTKKAKNTKYGTETVTFRAPEIWGNLPEEIRHSESLGIFKTRIKQWTPSDCKCRLCKTLHIKCRIYISKKHFLYIFTTFFAIKLVLISLLKKLFVCRNPTNCRKIAPTLNILRRSPRI